MRHLLGFLFAALCSLPSVPASAGVLRVNLQAGDAVEDGQSWSTAYRTLQAALQSAQPGDEVWVKYPGSLYNQVPYRLKAGVRLYGGFMGTETARDQRNPDNRSVIGGENPGAMAAGSGIIVEGGAPADTVIDGFTIRHCDGKANAGGIQGVPSASPTISNCRIEGNRGDFGGGIALMDSSAVITDCFIAANQSGLPAGGGSGGGIRALFSSVVIRDNVIAENVGGGVTLENVQAGGAPVTPIIERNVIRGNRTGARGITGIELLHSVDAVITNNVIAGNGSGVYIGYSAPTLRNNTIVANEEEGIRLDLAARPTILNTIVAYNRRGLHDVQPQAPSVPVLRHNDVYGNSGGDFVGVADVTGQDGNIRVDPGFRGMDDYHLRPDSPLLDAGDSVGIPAGETDMDGEARILGGAVDIGADEEATPGLAIRVAPDGNDAHDGASWQTAMRTVDAALARASAGDKVVWVKAGVYHEKFIMTPGLRLYGGFAGTESSLRQRSVAANPTILDAGGAGEVIRAQSFTVIDGMTLRNGEIGVYYVPNVTGAEIANSTIRDNGKHGLLLSNGASPAIRDNRIVENGSPASGVYGGGIRMLDLCAPVIEGNLIARNRSGSAQGGGALSALRAQPVIRNNTILANIGANNGASGLDFERCGGVVANNVIALNTGGSPAVEADASPAIRIINNTVVDNDSSGIALGRDSHATVLNNISAYNRNHGISLYYANARVENNITYGNLSSHIYIYESEQPGPSNLKVDPRLARDAAGNFLVQPDSPARDAGVTDPVVREAVGHLDITGQTRIRGEAIDIGAHETTGAALPPDGRVFRVAIGGTGDGSSWAAPLGSVQAGIEAAAVLGGEVWVKAGTYAERVTLKRGASLFGGFSGTEAAREGRDVRAHVTTLDGQGGGPVVSFQEWLAHTTVVEGFTVTGGSGEGAGFLISRTAPVIRWNVIVGNDAGTEKGGGLHIYGYQLNGDPFVHNNVIRGNGAAEGAAIYAGYGSGIIANNLITGNLRGTAVNLSEFRGVLDGNTIADNVQGVGSYRSWPVVSNNIIAFNANRGWSQNTGTPVFRHNLSFGNGARSFDNYVNLTNPTGTDGNISVDPLFVDRAGGDYHLQPLSPAVDAGSSADAATGLDMDGEARVRNGMVDIGADEAAQATPGPLKAAATLRKLGGLDAATPEDLEQLDADGDGQLTLPDAVHHLRVP